MSSAKHPSPASIANLIASGRRNSRPTLSFEFYPNRDNATAGQLWSAFDDVLNAGADFVSLTYGAGGSSQERSFEVLAKMAPRISTIGHLTAVGASRESVTATVRRFQDLGVASVLALRGDNPKDDPGARARSEVLTAIDLLELVDDVSQLETGVAAFPEKHPESPSLEHDAIILKKKQDAGAAYAITQLFFHAGDYLELLSKAREEGVSIEVLPGIMPITNSRQVFRMAELSGARLPSDLVSRLDGADESKAAKIGMDFSVDLAHELIAAGAPGLHIFTLNRSEAALKIASETGLTS